MAKLVTPKTNPDHDTVGFYFKGPWQQGLYYCDSYDSSCGFWMQNIDDPADRRNVSERAIGRTYHKDYNRGRVPFKLSPKGEICRALKLSEMKTVYVLYWEYRNPGDTASGGGHDWFHTEKDRDEGYVKMKNSDKKFANAKWKTEKTEIQVKAKATPEEITGEVDRILNS